MIKKDSDSILYKKVRREGMELEGGSRRGEKGWLSSNATARENGVWAGICRLRQMHANVFLKTIIAPSTSWCSINIC